VLAIGEGDVSGLLERSEAEGLRIPLRIGTVLADADVRVLGDQELERMGWQHRLG
jgi:hypothetical protein